MSNALWGLILSLAAVLGALLGKAIQRERGLALAQEYNHEMLGCVLDRRGEADSVTVQTAYQLCLPPVGVVHTADSLRIWGRRNALHLLRERQ